MNVHHGRLVCGLEIGRDRGRHRAIPALTDSHGNGMSVRPKCPYAAVSK
jgi:hypothetical protein